MIKKLLNYLTLTLGPSVPVEFNFTDTNAYLLVSEEQRNVSSLQVAVHNSGSGASEWIFASTSRVFQRIRVVSN